MECGDKQDGSDFEDCTLFFAVVDKNEDTDDRIM